MIIHNITILYVRTCLYFKINLIQIDPYGHFNELIYVSILLLLKCPYGSIRAVLVYVLCYSIILFYKCYSILFIINVIILLLIIYLYHIVYYLIIFYFLLGITPPFISLVLVNNLLFVSDWVHDLFYINKNII